MLTTRTVTTSGHGRVALARTTATLRVTAVHRAPGLADALAGAESARAAIVEVARRHVEPSAVATQSLDLWPAHDEAGQRAGFDARHSLVMQVASLETAAALVQSLADEVGERFTLDSVTPAAAPTDDDHRAARERAFADARATAEHLAGLAGAALGTVLSVSDGRGESGPAPSHRMLAATSDVGLEAGQEDLSAAVTVTWELV